MLFVILMFSGSTLSNDKNAMRMTVDKFLANLHSIGKLLRAKRECADVLRKRIVNFSDARWPSQWYRACGGRRRHGLE